MSWREDAKKRAAIEAVKLVKDGYVVGLGSGSTVSYAIKYLGRRIIKEKLRILGISTSYQASIEATESGIPLTTLDEYSKPDLTIDGADQIDRDMALIKGMGGALTREKIVASASKKLAIVADEDKLVDQLGINHPIPLEVLPFALTTVKLKMLEIGGNPVLRDAKRKVGPLITDNGNFIIDVNFGPIYKPTELNLKLKTIPGVIETGLFIDMADYIFIGKRKTVQSFEKNRR